MSTEDISPRYLDLDLWEVGVATMALFEAQAEAVEAVRRAVPAIAIAVAHAADRLKRGGRLVYVGAGTSGRLGALDGAELTPTFNWPGERVLILMAGGDGALLQAVENAEDAEGDGAARIASADIGANDVVIGIAASGATPFTVAAVQAARTRGALTIGIANNAGSALLVASEHPILIETGEEPIAGSTRFKAGTAQKAVLNILSTEMMVRLGRVYRGMMVHMRPTNEKLRRRAVRMVAAIAERSEADATAALSAADGDIPLAALTLRGLEVGAARALLDKHEGNLRAALAEIS